MISMAVLILTAALPASALDFSTDTVLARTLDGYADDLYAVALTNSTDADVHTE